MRQPVRVDTFLQQLRRLFPDRIVTRHERDAALLQSWDGVAGRAEHALGVFMRRGVGRYVLWVDQSVGLEVVASHRDELILVPHLLIVERQLRRTMRGGNLQKIRMPE